MIKEIKLILLSLLISNLVIAQENSQYLNSILAAIDEVKSATYTSTLTAGEAEEEIPYRSFQLFVKTYANPTDKYCGAGFVSAPINNRDEYDFCYDGLFQVDLDWEKNTAKIDTINNSNKGRPLAPFFMKAKSVLNYALENPDHTIIEHEEYNDSTKISFLFEGRRVELGRLIPDEKIVPGENSQYELWIDNKTNLPFYSVRKMAHQKTTERCSDLTIQKTEDIEFDALLQIPVDFSIVGETKREIKAFELEGKIAPNWNLEAVDGKNHSLENAKSKVVLLEFTSIGCGPCRRAIPFLKNLSDEYKKKELEVISIEIVSKKADALKRYVEKMGLNYKYMIDDGSTKNNYKVSGMPTFFILNENRVVKKIFLGFRKGETEKEIENSIQDMI